MSDDPLATLLAAMSRAEKSGRTDEQELTFSDSVQLCREFEDILVRHLKQSGGPLKPHEAFRAIAIFLGQCIANNHLHGELGAVMAAMQLCQVVLDVATNEEQP